MAKSVFASLLAALLVATVAPAPAAPVKGETRLSEFIRVNISNDRLLPVRSDGAVNAGSRVVQIAGLPGNSTIYMGGATSFFNFSHTAREEDGKGMTITQLNCSPTSFTFSRMIREGTRMQTTSLRQSSSGRDGAVTLHLTFPSGANAASQSIQAKGLSQLRKSNPDAFKKHADPLLREMRRLGILGVDSELAREALADPPVDQALRDKVAALVARLDAENFRDREVAASGLRQLGRGAIILLRGMDQTKLSAHQCTTIDAIITTSSITPQAEIDRLRSDAQFLIDCLYCEEESLRKLALERLAGVSGQPIQIDIPADPFSASDQIEALREKLAATRPAAK